MIVHWFTTAWRSLISNPLFSAITIISLSIGCAGALLAGSNIKQHLSFERHIADADRILILARKQNLDQLFNFPGSTTRFEGSSITRPSGGVAFPMKAAIDGKIPGMVAQTRMAYSSALFQTDQDELDRRQASPPLPGAPPSAPLPGTAYVDDDFFKFFDFEFVEGSPQGLQEPDAIIITQNRAERLFGKERAVGKTVQGIKGHTLRIIGVVRTLPPTTHMLFQTIAGLRTMQMVGTNVPANFEAVWNRQFGGYHYIKIAPDVSTVAFLPSARQVIQASADLGAKMSAPPPPPGAPPGFVSIGPTWEYSLVPLLSSHLAGPDVISFQSSGDPKMIWTLAGGAIVLLVVSSFNYVTLSLARSLRRRREVAVRKVLGASRGALVRQYLVESGMVTGISLLIGFAIAWFLHPWFARAIGQPETMFNLLDPVFIALALGLFTLLALTVGAYPAFFLAAVRPRTGLGEGGTASPGRIGQAVSSGLLGLQIAAAAGLLIISATMLAQANYVATRDIGFTIKDRYQVNLSCPTQAAMSPQERSAMFRRCNSMTRDVLKRASGVGEPFYFSGNLVSDVITTDAVARSTAGEELGRATQLSVDTSFLQNMDAKLIAGRFFDDNSSFDRVLIERQQQMMNRPPSAPGAPPGSAPPMPPMPTRVPVIITRGMLPIIGAETPDAAIGQQIAFKGQAPYPYEIVGVVEDWHVRPLKYDVVPVVFIPNYSSQAIITIPKDQVGAVVDAVRAEWRRATGDQRAAVFFSGMEDSLERSYQADFRLMYALVGFAGVAILVAGLGVYGLSAFEMRRRVREIGLRKALGATPANVAAMVIGRALLFAAIATVIAWPIGWWLAEQWLSAFVYRTPHGFILLPAASLAIMAFVTIAVAYNATRAAAVRPSTALQPN